MPVLGRKVGEGGSAEVHEWAPGQVVKLFRPAHGFAVDRELAGATAVNAAGVASPAVHGAVEVGGRRGIVFERLDGPTLLGELLSGARAASAVGLALAEVHLAMHAVAVPGLVALDEVLRAQGHHVPGGAVVFHGDFHPGNVIVGAGAMWTIDWVNAHRSTRTADVARTVMAVRYQALRADQPEESLGRERAARARILAAYLDRYLDAEPDGADGLATWLSLAAASLLRTEPVSADAADLHALADGHHADVTEPTLARLLASS